MITPGSYDIETSREIVGNLYGENYVRELEAHGRQDAEALDCTFKFNITNDFFDNHIEVMKFMVYLTAGRKRRARMQRLNNA